MSPNTAYESLDQRIVVRCHLAGLQPDEVEGYLLHRMKLAGADVPVFRDDAVRSIAQTSNGIPRRIDRVAHLALWAAALEKRLMVEPGDVDRAVSETGA
ncbi:MAG: hypothetical protein OXS40_04410 [Gammaproteobacteria bacterium]|nr:hypothetical protein [Gammaproteobacteria bacterium]